jgi:hypothetical protein
MSEMWGTVLLMAVVVAIDPAQVGAVAYILSRPRAMRLLVAYFVGGFGVSLIAGGVILFVLDGVGIGQSSSIPPGIEFAVGTLALVVAALVGSGVAGRLRDRAQSRRAGDQPADVPPSARDNRPSLERLPGFDKLPHRLLDALHNESPWIAWIYGVGFGVPSAYYLAAIAAILKSGVATGAQIGALLVFNLVAFAVADQHPPAARRDDADEHHRGVPDLQRVQQALMKRRRKLVVQWRRTYSNACYRGSPATIGEAWPFGTSSSIACPPNRPAPASASGASCVG